MEGTEELKTSELQKKLSIIKAASEEQEQQKQQEQTGKKGLTWLEKVQELQFYADRIRNICILAHVDHGKTTLSDSLISSNQIINQKLAGQLRYLDSREDEQQRMITMKASSISLLYAHKVKTKTDEKGEDGKPVFVTEDRQHLINLIDSPGHVDFSNEVSSALRMSDGALVLVDVVEGVSPQTHTVIRQAWAEKVKMCLVLNKIDRLIVDRQMEGQEIYNAMVQIIELINGLISELIKADIIAAGFQQDSKYDDMIEEQEKIYQFKPENGNVAFCSAYDCWSFTLPSFVPKVAEKLGMRPKVLQQLMWGQYYFNAKEKKVVKKPPTDSSQEMFVQYVMQPLVERYRKNFTSDVINNTALRREAQAKLKEKLSKFLPMEEGIMRMIAEHLPSPDDAQINRYKQFCPALGNAKIAAPQQAIKDAIIACKPAIKGRENNPPTIVYVTKMQPFSSRIYDIITKAEEKSKDRQRLIAVARVFSGALTCGQKVFVMGPKHQFQGQQDVKEIVIDKLFLLMGSTLKMISHAPAGSIVGIGGLDDVLFKTGTISDSPDCPNFLKLTALSLGLVKVAVQSKDYADMEFLKEGLAKLNKSDPSVNFGINDKGQLILSTCGEIHLQRCLKDLQDDFCPGVQIECSDPIIPFRETIVNKRLSNRLVKNKQDEYEEADSNSEESEEEADKLAKADKRLMTVQEMIEYEERLEEYNKQLAAEKELLRKEQALDPYLEKLVDIKLQQGNLEMQRRQQEMKGWSMDLTANKLCEIKIRAVGLHTELTKWLEKQLPHMKGLQDLSALQTFQNVHPRRIELANNFVVNFFEQLKEHKTSQKLIRLIRDFCSGFGPKPRLGSNLLINMFNEPSQSIFNRFATLAGKPDILPKLDFSSKVAASKYAKDCDKNMATALQIFNENKTSIKEFNGALLSGFDMAVQKGPLMDEPMQGSVFIVEGLQSKKDQMVEGTEVANYGPFAGQVMATVKNLCKRAFLNADPRIGEAMYKCSLVATQQTYGVCYNVIEQSRGKVLNEDLLEGTNDYLMDVLIPLIEGLKFADAIRKQTSGSSYPQLLFHGFEVDTATDPLFLPLSEEDIEEYGEGTNLNENIARQLIERVRKIKGMTISKKIMIAAEKQRTLTKNK